MLEGLYITYALSRAKRSASVPGALCTQVSDDADLGATIAEIASLVDRARLALDEHDTDGSHRLLNHWRQRTNARRQPTVIYPRYCRRRP